MKIKGFSLIEVLVSILLFFISLIPLLKYTSLNFKINREYLKLEKRYRNFIVIRKQILNRDTHILLENFGKNSYDKESFGRDSLTEGIYIPYDLEGDFKLEINISKRVLFFKEREEEYLNLKIMYIDRNKNLISENYVDINRGEYEE